MPDPPAHNECLVCGAPSTLRCSSCAAKSSIALFFCSKEHQQLAWPYHKLVCGERAHPFQLPPLSATEADLVLLILNTDPEGALEVMSQRDVKVTLERLREELGWSSSVGAEPLVRRLIEKEVLTAEEQMAVRRFRAAEIHWACRMPNAPPCERLVFTFSGIYDSLVASAPDSPVGTLWHSHFCHLLLVTIDDTDRECQCRRFGLARQPQPEPSAGSTKRMNKHLMTWETPEQAFFGYAILMHMHDVCDAMGLKVGAQTTTAADASA